MTENYETEIRFRRWLRDQHAVTPYQEMQKWRKRFWWALFFDMVLGALVLILAGAVRAS